MDYNSHDAHQYKKKNLVISFGYSPKYIRRKKKEKNCSKRCLFVSAVENLTSENWTKSTWN
jgi:hypothetical protein